MVVNLRVTVLNVFVTNNNLNTTTSVNWTFVIKKSWAPLKNLEEGDWGGSDMMLEPRFSMTKMMLAQYSLRAK